MNYTGYVGAPLTDTIRADFAAIYAHQGKGWGRNLLNGRDAYSVDHQYTLRSKWLLEPSDATRVTIIGDITDSSDTMSSTVAEPGTISPAAPGLGPVPDLGYNTVANGPDAVAQHSWGVSGKLEQQFGPVELTSITAFRKGNLTLNFDADALPVDSANIFVTNSYRQFSEELRLQSSAESSLKWVIGGFYLKGKAGLDNVVNLPEAGINIFLRNDQTVRSLAGFAQASYEILPQTNLTGGVRYTTERKSEVDANQDIGLIANGFIVASNPFPTRTTKFKRVTIRASVDHRFSDQLLGYVSYNTGVKSGGFNTVSPGSAPFAPEKVTAYEVGLKSDLFDRRLRLNVAGYYYDYSNIQVIVFQTGQLAIINGPSARIYGVDADLDVSVSDRLQLSGGLNWGQPEFGSWIVNGVPTCPILNPAGGTPAGIGDCKGKLIPLANRVTANARADYEAPLANGKLRVSGVVSYNSGFYFSPDNAIKSNGNTLINANVAWVDPSEHLTISLFGRNLTNRRVTRFIDSDATTGSFVSKYNAPRTYGVSLDFRY